MQRFNDLFTFAETDVILNEEWQNRTTALTWVAHVESPNDPLDNAFRWLLL
jgi:hypothetical protein